jgi:hypothetical protein
MKIFSRSVIIGLLVCVYLFGQEEDTIMVVPDTLPVLDMESISDTIIQDTSGVAIETEETDEEMSFWTADDSPVLGEASPQHFMFSAIPWEIPGFQVETLLKIRGFSKDPLDRWTTQAGKDRVFCYPNYQENNLTGFQIVYIPENRSETGLLDRYRKIVQILAEKYGNPSNVSVYDMKEYMPDKRFYTHRWTAGKETLTASINRSDRHIDVQYFIEPDSVRIRKNEVEKRLHELF